MDIDCDDESSEDIAEENSLLQETAVESDQEDDMPLPEFEDDSDSDDDEFEFPSNYYR